MGDDDTRRVLELCQDIAWYNSLARLEESVARAHPARTSGGGAAAAIVPQ
ncbi:hypothetical protein [Streptomyces sp. NPDC101165]